MKQRLSTLSLALWDAIASAGRPVHASEIDAPGMNCRKVGEALYRLSVLGYLASDRAAHPRYSVAARCKVPEGRERPAWLAEAVIEAGVSAPFVPCPPDKPIEQVALRSGAFDYAARPSRRGNRLVYRDGRVTDLQGNPLEAADAAA